MYLDEFEVGQSFQTARYKITKNAIITFAQEYDPEYMHVDEQKAAAERFGGIIASGIHTVAITFKLWVSLGLHGDEVIAGTQMKDIQFLYPVYPEDILHVIATVVSINKNENTGILTVHLSTNNDKDTQVLSCEVSILMKRDPHNIHINS